MAFFIKVNKGVRNKYPSSKSKTQPKTVSNLKKTTITIIILTVYLASFLIFFTLPHAKAVDLLVEASDLSPSVKIQVNHLIEVKDGGIVAISDTIKLYTQSGETADPINDFLIGFPFEYLKKAPFGGSSFQVIRERFNPDYCFAYDSQGRLEVFSDVGMGRLGYYGAKVVFPQQVNITDGHSYSFTVMFIFSNILQTSVSTTDTSRVEWKDRKSTRLNSSHTT